MRTGVAVVLALLVCGCGSPDPKIAAAPKVATFALGIWEIERYNAATAKRLQGTWRAPSTATDFGASSAGAVYRIGTTIYFLGAHERAIRAVWKTSGTPIGLSIEIRRIAWGANVNGHGRVVALTAPG